MTILLCLAQINSQSARIPDIDLSKASALTMVAVVKKVAESDPVSLPTIENGHSTNSRLGRIVVDVIDSNTTLGNRVVLLCQLDRAGRPTLQLDSGRNYFILGFKGNGGTISRATDEWLARTGTTVPIDRKFTIYERSQPNQQFCVFAAQTSKQVLPDADNPRNLMLLGLSQCLPNSSDSNLRDVLAMFEQTHDRSAIAGPGLLARNYPAVIESMMSSLPTLSAYGRAKVWQQLNRWKVSGAGLGFYRELLLCRNDESAFTSSSDVLSVGEINGAEVVDGARTPVEIAQRVDQLLEKALSARNKSIQHYLIMLCGWEPVRERQKQVLELVADSHLDDDIAANYLSRLALWNDDTEHVPQFEIVNRIRVLRNRSQLTQYWRQYL